MKSHNKQAADEQDTLDERGTLSGGNVFADLGFADADIELVKADLVLALGTLIDQRQLSQRAAAQLLRTTQPKVSLLLRGHTADISVSKLLEHLNRISHDVTIQVTPSAHPGAQGVTKVVVLDAARSAFRQVAAVTRRVTEPMRERASGSRPTGRPAVARTAGAAAARKAGTVKGGKRVAVKGTTRARTSVAGQSGGGARADSSSKRPAPRGTSGRNAGATR